MQDSLKEIVKQFETPLTPKQQEVLQEYSPTTYMAGTVITVAQWIQQVKEFNTAFRENCSIMMDHRFPVDMYRDIFEEKYPNQDSILHFNSTGYKFIPSFENLEIHQKLQISGSILKRITEDKECMEHLFNLENTFLYEDTSIRVAHKMYIQLCHYLIHALTGCLRNKNGHSFCIEQTRKISQHLFPWYFYNQKYRKFDFKRAHISPTEDEDEEEEEEEEKEEEEEEEKEEEEEEHKFKRTRIENNHKETNKYGGHSNPTLRSSSTTKHLALRQKQRSSCIQSKKRSSKPSTKQTRFHHKKYLQFHHSKPSHKTTQKKQHKKRRISKYRNDH
jgi:ssDNA-binding Zn-finger/Zn-ribbon topoisomerase 1